jgi:hypothetical protein
MSSYVNRNLSLSDTVTLSNKSSWTLPLARYPVHILHTPFLQHINTMLLAASYIVLYTRVNMIGTINRDELNERNVYHALDKIMNIKL